MKKFGWTARFVAAIVSVHAVADAVSVEVTDQEHADSNAYETYHNIQLHQPLGQSFKPAFGALDFVDLWLLDIGSREEGGGSFVKLTLRLDGLEGQAISESGLVKVPDGYDGVTRFVFNERVQLEKEETYFLELTHVEGEPAAVRNYGDLFAGYDRGDLYLGGRKIERSDMWFRSGVTIERIELLEVTREGFAWTGVAPLPFEVWRSHDLIEWTLVQRIVSESNRYEFRKRPGVSDIGFYRVLFIRE